MQQDNPSIETHCRQCGHQLHSERAHQSPSFKCTQCGCEHPSVHASNLDDQLQLRDCLRIKVKEKTESKNKVVIEIQKGSDLRRKDWKWMDKERYINHEQDLYREIVTDPETAEVIHECEEPLSEHKGHGSDKNREK